ncbi:MAG: hypothetical protein RL722_1643 [Pseudomonadota bacterium]|jgi:RNA polymerase sigma factor (sigma-70 family)
MSLERHPGKADDPAAGRSDELELDRADSQATLPAAELAALRRTAAQPGADPAAVHQAINTVWRAEAPRLIAALHRLLRDLDAAEDCAQDALIAALEHWPREGLPDRPAAWLMTTAKHRALDGLRHRRMAAERQAELGADLEAREALVVPDFVDALDAARQDEVGDDLLRLILTACHPSLALEARTALALRLLGGLTTAEIARAYLVPEATVAQRIVRAKRQLGSHRPEFDLPRGAQAEPERLAAVLEVLYLIFNEGYAASSGPATTRPALCEDALRLARLLAGALARQLPPAAHAEALSLLALMELQVARLPARHDAAGQPVRLAEQDRSRWDALAMRRGLHHLAQAEAAAPPVAPGAYLLQARIAACHARAPHVDATRWVDIVAAYDGLLHLNPSPVLALNRAMALAMAEGPAAGLAAIETLLARPAAAAALAGYPWLHAARAELLDKLARREEARLAWTRAADLSPNPVEQAELRRRAAGAS